MSSFYRADTHLPSALLLRSGTWAKCGRLVTRRTSHITHNTGDDFIRYEDGRGAEIDRREAMKWFVFRPLLPCGRSISDIRPLLVILFFSGVFVRIIDDFILSTGYVWRMRRICDSGAGTLQQQRRATMSQLKRSED
jgi:hypothetical protein